MTPIALLVTLGVGGLVGLVSGLVGIGGGMLVVPFLYFLFAVPEWSGVSPPPDHRVVVAHATSLFVIIPTVLAGIRAYHKGGLVPWRVVVPMGVGAALAAALGARLAIALPPALLRSAFCVLLLGTALKLFRSPAEPLMPAPPPIPRGLPVSLLAGAAVGVFSALMGVGGGIVAIPLLIGLVGLELERVAAASIGIIAFAAPAGVLAYALSGWGVPGLPPGTVGYVYLPAGLAMLPGAVLLAGTGARLNQELSPRRLQLLFAWLFLALGVGLLLPILGGR